MTTKLDYIKSPSLSLPLSPSPTLLVAMFAGSEKLQQVKVSEAHSGSNTKQYSKLREMHKAIFALLQNPTLFFLNLAGASEGEEFDYCFLKIILIQN